MAKRYNIRWNDADNEELRKTVRNFNDKIRRIEKRNPELKHILPDKITVGEMKEMIDTRQDLKRELNALKRFNSRDNRIGKLSDGTYEGITVVPDNEYNLKITNWQKNEMETRVKRINKKRNERREFIANIDMTSRGKSLGYKRGQLGMGKADEIALEPMKAFTESMNRPSLKKKYKNIQKESQSMYWNRRELQLKQNFMQAIEENFNPNDVKDVLNAIDGMEFEEFYKVFMAEDSNFESPYPPDAEQYEAYLSALKTTWLPEKRSA